jgi:hypothetical protein
VGLVRAAGEQERCEAGCWEDGWADGGEEGMEVGFSICMSQRVTRLGWDAAEPRSPGDTAYNL